MSKVPSIPSIPLPGEDRKRFDSAVKEALEISLGIRGEADQQRATKDDIASLDGLTADDTRERTIWYAVDEDTQLTDETMTTVVTTTAKTVTLPEATEARIGRDWTVVLGVDGYADVTVNGADTIILPTSDDTIRMSVKGSSVSLRCMADGVWGLV